MSPSSKRLSLPRKLAFAAVLSSLALAVVLGGLEGGLRLADYGYSAHFARRVQLDDGTRVWRENRWCTAPFFSPELVRRPQPMRLPVIKPPRTFRIIVLGSSAAMGDPEASFSLARVLEKMLPSAYPDIRFEVVNAGITAINSHVVRGIARDCAELGPDLFIVYEGHNEVIGPFGPSGVFTPFLRREGAVRAAVWMKGMRTGQLFAAAGRTLRAKAVAPAEWGGMEMFLAQRIDADDSRLDAVRAHFRANLLAIAGSTREAGAAAIVCTVAANQRTFAPFASLHQPGLGADDLAAWDAAFARAETALRAGNRAEAARQFHVALSIDDRHAELHYRLGQLELLAGNTGPAQRFLQRSLDLDALRFRADSALNETIRALPVSDHLRVVDAAAALAAASPYGICGDEFFFEHVHLTLRGTHELARALLPSIGAELARRGLAKTAAPVSTMDYDALRGALGYHAYEQGMIAAEMVSRLQRAPFTAQSDHATRLEVWQRRVATAQALLERPDAVASLRAASEAALAASPDGDWILSRNIGMMLVARGEAAEAVPHLERALAWIDDEVDTLAALATAHRVLGHTAEADALFARVQTLEPRHPAVAAGP